MPGRLMLVARCPITDSRSAIISRTSPKAGPLEVIYNLFSKGPGHARDGYRRLAGSV